jgi:hypothetical protein
VFFDNKGLVNNLFWHQQITILSIDIELSSLVHAINILRPDNENALNSVEPQTFITKHLKLNLPQRNNNQLFKIVLALIFVINETRN